MTAVASSGYLASPTSASPVRPRRPSNSRPDRRLPRLRHGRGLDQGHLHRSSNAPGGQTYTANACTNAGMTTACVGPQSITSGGQITGLDHAAGLGGHRLLRDRHGHRLDRLPRLGASTDVRPAERHEPGERADRRHSRLLDDDGRSDHRHLHRLDGHGAQLVHGDRLHQRGDDDRVRHPDELHLGRPDSPGSRPARPTT